MGQSTPISSKTSLIVEDEGLVSFDVAEFFEEQGWQVYEAENADEAIALLDHHQAIRVVLTDVQMPGTMDGVRLAHYERSPPTLLFVASGHAPINPEALPTRGTFIPKPFDLNRVLRQIKQASA